MLARHTPLALAAFLGAAPLAAGRAAAQSAGETLAGIPAAMFPPPGACRIWLDGVAPSRQPQLMDCATAESRAPADARVVYGVTARRSAELAGAGTVDRRPPTGVDRRPPDLPDEPDVPAATGSGCTDGNGDGFCDEVRLPVRPPGQLPRMKSAVVYQRFRGRAGDVSAWLGDRIPLDVRFSDANGDDSPERVEWSSDGTPLQVWVDVNRDGRADQVGLYQNGRIVRVVGLR